MSQVTIDKNELRELINEHSTSLQSSTSSFWRSLNITIENLDNRLAKIEESTSKIPTIEEHLRNLNSKVATHEKEISGENGLKEWRTTTSSTVTATIKTGAVFVGVITSLIMAIVGIGIWLFNKNDSILVKQDQKISENSEQIVKLESSILKYDTQKK